MVADVDQGALDFFRAMHQQFEHVLFEHRGSESMLPAVLSLALTSYEGSVDLQSQGAPEPECRKGCATCCTIRVVATAPEVFLVARYLRAMDDQLKALGLDIRQRLTAADEVTRDCDEDARVSLRRQCPYIHRGACVIYAVRPLACRSHMSYSQKACADAAAGRLNEVPYSQTHLSIRSLVQNAMQSALRDAGYPWATYELNHALTIALTDEQAEQSWLATHDILGSARVKDVSANEMAAAFDHIHGRSMSS